MKCPRTVYTDFSDLRVLRNLGDDGTTWCRGWSCAFWTYRTESAITRHLLYVLVRKGLMPVLSGVPDGRNCEGNMLISPRIDLFWHFKGTMTSYLSFRAVGPTWLHSPQLAVPVSCVLAVLEVLGRMWDDC